MNQQEYEQEMKLFEIKKEQELAKPELDELRLKLVDEFDRIVSFLKNYSELREEYYHIVALWIIGTYLHSEFESFPFLFINAMKGSGKTRLEKIISHLSNGSDGQVHTGITESILFRTKKGSTLVLDECESMGSKEKATLREYLNASYKKGATVARSKKVKTKDGEDYMIEEFEPYRPIVMANIWGLEEVLQDRCITLILEKSNNSKFTRKIEDFTTNPTLKSIKANLSALACRLCRSVSQKNYIYAWNMYIDERYSTCNDTTTDTYITTKTTLTTQEIKEDQRILFNKIHDTNIEGRNLELSFPFYIISYSFFLDEDFFNLTLENFKKIMHEKKEDEFAESRDVTFIDFISQMEESKRFIPVREITHAFKEYLQQDDGEDKWINEYWIGRALKRLNLIVEKRRAHRGREVILNVPKAQEKIKMFKDVTTKEVN